MPPKARRLFSEEEKNGLVSISKSHKFIIENKRTDSVTLQEKNREWKRIAEKFNAMPYCTRPTNSKQLKKLWKNLKQRQRNAIARVKKHRLGTGGGPPVDDAEIDPNIAEVAPQLLVSIEGAIDSDTFADPAYNAQSILELEPSMPQSPDHDQLRIPPTPRSISLSAPLFLPSPKPSTTTQHSNINYSNTVINTNTQCTRENSSIFSSSIINKRARFPSDDNVPVMQCNTHTPCTRADTAIFSRGGNNSIKNSPAPRIYTRPNSQNILRTESQTSLSIFSESKKHRAKQSVHHHPSTNSTSHISHDEHRSSTPLHSSFPRPLCATPSATVSHFSPAYHQTPHPSPIILYPLNAYTQERSRPIQEKPTLRTVHSLRLELLREQVREARAKADHAEYLFKREMLLKNNPA